MIFLKKILLLLVLSFGVSSCAEAPSTSSQQNGNDSQTVPTASKSLDNPSDFKKYVFYNMLPGPSVQISIYSKRKASVMERIKSYFFPGHLVFMKDITFMFLPLWYYMDLPVVMLNMTGDLKKICQMRAVYQDWQLIF